MTNHPAALMIRVWLACIALFLLLPFELLSRQVSLFGFVVLLLFLTSFVIGSLIASPTLKQMPRSPDTRINFRQADFILISVATLATIALLFDLIQQNFGDLSAAFIERNDRATALMTGSNSGGSFVFQIGFLLFPASYVYAVRIIIFESKPTLWKLGLFGFLPPILAALTTGGRGSLLYALVIALLALRARSHLATGTGNVLRPKKQRTWALFVVLIVAGLVSLNYFVQVFVVRVEGFGGIEHAMTHAALDWGVSFEGNRAKFLRAVIGEGNTYLLFLFSWYIVQGLIISNEIFSLYDGPLGYGIYSIDLITAVARRINGDAVAERFLTLLDLNIYGFLPSAFGSLFVDLNFGAVVLVFIWGYIAGVVYRLTRKAVDLRWILAAPFITMGIIFSLVNTPLGFNNGLMTHFWLIVALVAVRTIPSKEAAT